MQPTGKQRIRRPQQRRQRHSAGKGDGVSTQVDPLCVVFRTLVRSGTVHYRLLQTVAPAGSCRSRLSDRVCKIRSEADLI